MNHKQSRKYMFLRVLTLLAITLSWVQFTPRTAKAQTNTLTLSVVSARTEPNHPGGPVNQGDSIPTYNYLINVDNTGDPSQPRYPDCSPYLADGSPNTAYPDSCNWPSIRAVPGAAPIFTQGDQDDFASGGLSLPDGKYLISVMAEGYKIGGAHFTMPLEDPGLVTVELQPHPLPPATMEIMVFEDISSTNGQFDAPAEHGLAGFKVLINDVLGQISTDVHGNPLCTLYDANGDPLPTPPGFAGDWCLYSGDGTGNTADPTYRALGQIKVPNLGTNRYDVNVIPAAGTSWIQTTTLEGSHSWDTWLQEGGTGLDNEFVVAGEPFPWTVFGFVNPTDTLNDPSVTGSLSGRIVAASVYTPQGGGLPYYGGQWGGLNGARVTGPITDAWIALSDLQNGDTAVYVGPANADGTFNITNIPDGNYLMTYWDYRQMYILDWMQVTVSSGQETDLGTPFLTGWFTFIEGYVFDDLNANGLKDAGEPGISDYLVVLKDRDNTEIDRMTIAVTTDADGYYFFDRAYPMGSWMILEAYSDRYYGTGVSYKVENQPDWTTVLGNGVDVGVLPILGHTGRLDWGVHAYAPGTNGGIVGTVFYDTTRNELDARYQAVEGWAPGIPGLTMNLWAPVACGTNPGTPCDGSNMYELAPDGSIARGTLLNSAVTETWEQPVDCLARDANGNPTDQYALPPETGGFRCLEAPMTGLQFQNGFASLDGNYGFTEGCFGVGGFDPAAGTCADGSTPQTLPAGDYLVEVDIPNDSLGRPLYLTVKEEDINVFNGDEYSINVPPPACAGPLHTVHVVNDPTQALFDPLNPFTTSGVYNPSFLDAGGSPYEGMQRPLCNVKLVTLSNGRSIAPTFNLFTVVPIPGKWKGYIIDDLTVATNQQDLLFGEKAGFPNAPIGVYDFTNHLLTTITSDPNGVYEVLLPSTYTINCPTPSGVCPNVYYLLGNDPGQPGNLNLNYNPQYRTIGASFEIWPGAILPSDLAPTQIGVSILAPQSNLTAPAQCTLSDSTPQLFAVSQPYADLSLGVDVQITISGSGFGATPGSVTLDGTILLPVVSWTNYEIVVTIPAASTPAGPHQLDVTAQFGQRSANGLTLHALKGSYVPVLYEVGPGHPYSTIQSAINDASTANPGNALVVVYPGVASQWNPTGAYYENLVLYAPVKLQGVGPGGVRLDQGAVLGTVLDGAGVAGDAAYADDWRVFVEGLAFDGNQVIYEGPVIYVLAEDGEFTSAFPASIDGFTIQGGDQQGFPNVQPIDPTVRGIGPVQGGGIFANAYARYLQITNNLIHSNGGAYAGAIRLGTPHLTGGMGDNQNDFVRISHNRIYANGGTNLAGAIGIFSGSEGYEVSYNDLCGNFSAEYGGGISHYGYSPNSSVHHNRIYFNRSYDEGGGVIIAGELPADPGTLSPGAGPVDIFANLIQANLGNDDGGGLRFLMAGNFPYNVYNNMIVNNVSTHEGGGISLNDAPDVRIYNNTIMKNITTATAVTSNGFPAPAGLSTSRNSDLLQATLPGGSPLFSEPLVFNNIFWDNRAGTWTGGGVAGIGLPGDPAPINYWDMGVSDGIGMLYPTSSLIQTTAGYVNDASNIINVDPGVLLPFDISVSVLPWRGHPTFVDALIVAVQLPPEQMGNFHVSDASAAVNAGASAATTIFGATINVPLVDFDGDPRPSPAGYEIGADEITSPVYNFPFTPVLDTFNRANGVLGANWAGNTNQGSYRILSNQVQVRTSGSVYWVGGTFGANQEAYMTLTKIVPTATEQGLLLKLTGSSPFSSRAAYIEVNYNATTGNVEVWTRAPGQGRILRATIPATFVNGDQLGARVTSDGMVRVFQNRVQIGSTNVASGPNPWPTAYLTGGGRIGVLFTAPSFAAPNDARFDDFGGGTMP